MTWSVKSDFSPEGTETNPLPDPTGPRLLALSISYSPQELEALQVLPMCFSELSTFWKVTPAATAGSVLRFSYTWSSSTFICVIQRSLFLKAELWCLLKYVFKTYSLKKEEKMRWEFKLPPIPHLGSLPHTWSSPSTEELLVLDGAGGWGHSPNEERPEYIPLILSSVPVLSPSPVHTPIMCLKS